jgi:hypothetical protein
LPDSDGYEEKKLIKKFIRKITILNAALLAWVAGFFLFSDKVALIIALGLKGANLLILLNIIVPAAIFVVGNGLLVLRNKQYLITEKPKEVLLTSGMENKEDPDHLRRDLNSLIDATPELAEILGEGVAQMDSIDNKQAKLKGVLARNDLGALREVENSINEAEVNLCKNLSKVVDRAIMLDSLERNSSERGVVVEENKGRIRRILKANNDILSLCDILLTESINYLDEKNSSGDSGGQNLTAMTEAIQTLRTLNGREV